MANGVDGAIVDVMHRESVYNWISFSLRPFDLSLSLSLFLIMFSGWKYLSARFVFLTSCPYTHIHTHTQHTPIRTHIFIHFINFMHYTKFFRKAY